MLKDVVMIVLIKDRRECFYFGYLRIEVDGMEGRRCFLDRVGFLLEVWYLFLDSV